ncbi:AMP-binding protein [Nonomuraea thailandensis]
MGVEGTHRQLVNHALWCRTAFAHHPGEVTFLSTSLFLPGSLTTIFTPLLAGWPIVIAPDGATADALLELSGTAAGGLLELTPAQVRVITARGVPGGGLARQLMVGGEPLAFGPELREWMRADPDRVVVNHYGAAGTHGCFCHWLTGGEELGSTVPVGRPIDNVEAYIVDRHCALVEVGEVGELLVGGPSIGRGYRGRPMPTAERWIPHPWGDGATLLRTGDLARLEPDGAVTVVGRAGR